VRHPESKGYSNGVEPWETTLVDLLSESEGSEPRLDVQDILDVMRNTIHNKHKYLGSVHCEMAVVSLAVFFGDLLVTDIKSHHLLVDILQVIFCLCDHDAHQSDVMHRTWTEPPLQCQSGAAQLVENSWTS
jgi:hypothetical protein